MEIFSQFDTYSLKARVFPALIAGLPTLTLLFIIVPWDHLDLSHVIAVAMGAVLLFAFADMARHRGKKVQEKLGTGETPDQWHRDNPDVPEGSKDRYREFVAAQLNQSAPTVEDEKLRPQHANDFYRSANAWLREESRDHSTFNLLFSENITYGFRRNLLGLKTTALFCNSVVLILCVGILYFGPSYFASLPKIDEKIIIVITSVVLHSAYMMAAVHAAVVREASRAYGRQLILSCETLIRTKKSNSTEK
ncbi:hypothetical protein [Pseudomonas svalbardensis]|uniref:hypothetical protein n=1 Tax=Pseudomonas svalbardensis TaxID=3042029 RepID=UPI0024B3A050|nr:hypothetical protein [Pseudomonas sp. PMCC200367]